MATINTFPPDVPKGWDEAADEAGKTASRLRDRAADMADHVGEKVRDGYHRAKDTLAEVDPVQTARDGGEAVARAVERHPVFAFGLGALSVGLIAWASMRSSPVSRWESYQPDYGKLRRLLRDYAGEASQASENALKVGETWLRGHRDEARDYAQQARGFAEEGGRVIARRAQREPVAALIGVGIAVYVLGSLLTSSSQAAPARRRAGGKR